MNRLLKTFLLVLSASLAAALPARAATSDWLVSAASQDFNAASNWTTALALDASCYVDVTAGDTPILFATPTANVGMLEIGAADGAYTGNGYMKQTAGVLTIDNDFAVGYGYTGGYDMTGGTITQAAGNAWVGRGGTGTMNIGLLATDNPTVTFSSSGWFRVSADTSNAVGTLNVNAGTFNVTNLDVGLAHGAMNVHNIAIVNTSGTVLVGDGGTGNITVDGTSTLNLLSGGMTVGNGGNGSLTILGSANVHLQGSSSLVVGFSNGSNGVVTLGNGTDNPNLTIDAGASSLWGGGAGTATVNINSGTFNNNTGLWMSIGFNGSTTVWNQNGGTSTMGVGTGDGAYWGCTDDDNGPASNNTINLNAGVFATGIVKSDWALSGTGRANMIMTFNFNGGTLQATGASTVGQAFFWTRGGGYGHFNVYVKSNGGTFDTNGFYTVMGLPLLTDATSLGGGFTKIGGGTLLMDQNDTYTGPTAVNVGELQFAGSNATSAVTVQPGAALTLMAAIPFVPTTVAKCAVTIPTGATLNIEGSGGSGVDGTGANVFFGNKSFLTASSAGGFVSTLEVNKISSASNTDKVIVSVTGLGSGGGGGTVLIYDNLGTFHPLFVAQTDSSGMVDYSVTDDGFGDVSANVVNQTTRRGFLGQDAGLNTTPYWTKSLWFENGSGGAYPNGTGARAWFNDATGLVATHTCLLDTNVTESSMLFNGSYTVSVDPAHPTSAITLQTTIAVDTQIQVISGTSSMSVNLKLASGDPIISVAGSSSLTLSGVLSDLDPAHPASVTITGPGTLALTGASTYSGTTVLQGGLLMVGNASALGAAGSAFTFAGGTAGGTVTDAGADVALNKGFVIAGTDVLAPVHNLTFTGPVTYTSGGLTMAGAGTATFNTPTVTTNSFGNLSTAFAVTSGTVAFNGVAGTVYNVGTLNVAFAAGLHGAVTMTGAESVSIGGPTNVGAGNAVASFTVGGTSQATVGGLMTVGNFPDAGGTSSLAVIDGAHLTVNSDLRVGYNWASGSTSFGTNSVTVGGGTAAGATATVTGSIIIGADGSNGAWNQEVGGLTVASNPVIIADYDATDPPSNSLGNTPGVGVLNLDGGTFRAPSLTTRSNVGGTITGTSGTVNFNGGVLQASAGSANFIVVDSTLASVALNVKTGGAIIDTNSFAVTINQPLVAASTTGGLTKQGAGTLTLTAADTYTGLTVVKKGTLKLTEAASEAVLHTTTTGLGADIQGGYLVFDYNLTGNTPVNTVRSNLLSSYTTGSGTMSGGKMFTSTGALSNYGIGYVDDPVAKTVTAQVAVFGDANLDGTVNLLDLTALANHWKQTGYWAQGDFNYDGTVNLLDLTLLAAHWKKSLTGITFDQALAMVGMAPAISTPEPGTMVLLGCGLFGLLAYAWRKRK